MWKCKILGPDRKNCFDRGYLFVFIGRQIGVLNITIEVFVHYRESTLNATCYNYSVLFEDFIREFRGSKQLKFEQLPFNHPLFIMYSSGTTGTPKCMVHSAGVSVYLV